MTTFGVNLLGGGWVQMRLDAHDLNDVSEQLRRERSLIGDLLTTEPEGPATGRVLIPAGRVVMVSEV